MNRSARLFFSALALVVVMALPATASAVVPSFTLTEPADGQKVNGSLGVNGYSSNVDVVVNCTLDNVAPYSTYTAGCNYMPRYLSVGYSLSPNLSEGTHYFTAQVIAQDGSNNTVSITRSFVVDRTAPTVSINSGPAQGSNYSGHDFTWGFTANESSTFDCEFDGGGFSACNGGTYTVGGVLDGSHTFKVRANDGVNTSGEVTRTFNVNNAPPTVSINDINAVIPTSTPYWTLTKSRNDALLDCRMDNGPWTDCSSGDYTSDPLTDGDHTFEARAYLTGPTDIQDPPDSQTFTVDTTGPTVELNSPLAAFGGTSASFDFSSTAADVDHFVCYTDFYAHVANPCSSPYQVNLDPGEAAGAHTVNVFAIDSVGNAGPEATWDWVQYPTLPTTSISVEPEPTTAVQVANFEFSSPTATQFECAIDGVAFTSCSSSYAVSGLAAGPHVLQVRAKDPAGQLDDSPASAVFTMLPPPVIVKPSKPNASAPGLGQKSLKLTVTGASSVKVTVQQCKKKKVKGKKKKSKLVCKKVTGGSAVVAADGTVTVKFAKKLKKKSKYRVTIVVTGADGQKTTVVKTLKAK